MMNDFQPRAVNMLESEMEACLSGGESSRLARLLLDEGLTEVALSRLNLLVRKRLSSTDSGRVDVVLKSLDILLDDKHVAQNLLALAITYKVLSWFRTLRDHWVSGSQGGSAQQPLTESFYDILMLSRSQPPGSELAVILLELLQTLLESRLIFTVRLEATRTFNSILDSLGRDERKRVRSDEALQETMSEVAAAIHTVGDYELQASLLEALCRLTPRKERMARAAAWFPRGDLAEAFCLIETCSFEVDCRRFLNFLNRGREDRERVWTFPCARAFLENIELFRPKDDKLDEFWVDFNLGSQSVTFFVNTPEGFLWHSVHLLKEEVDRYRLELRQDEGNGSRAVLGVLLKVPVVHLDRKGHRVELLFRPELLEELRTAAVGVFEKEAADKDPGGEVPPSATGPLCGHYRKKPRAKLRVLPLSPPSGPDHDDSRVYKISRSSPEILFHRVVQSTPLKDSGILFDVEPETFQVDNISPITKDDSSLSRKRDSGSLSYQSDDPTKRRGGLRPEGAESADPLPNSVGDSLTAGPRADERPPSAEERLATDATSGIMDAFDDCKRKLEQYYQACRQKVQAQVLLAPQEFQQHVNSLFSDIQQYRLALLNNFETSLLAHLKCLEETSTYLDSVYSQVTSIFQSEKRRLSDFYERHRQRLGSSGSGEAEPASGQ
ncbi:synaptonemal complex protein 2-like isoform X3 [Corythoichthys intestinalis]|uniref:synaptonemal complex protein 2-like isoform X3 n=1 Tax=Corythoichthys intestinalis TaxID=161448 RepID=UPI0025A5A88D|nr:synaptonemal complex protein 2-like isoform X3 [Corythoichthys intestinalis]